MEEVAGDEMDEAHLVHKEANAVWPPHVTKYTGYDVPFRVIVGSLSGMLLCHGSF